ncbi:MAG: hypothetical protein CSA97_02420 [Bacteroidetes bacterium]|nr:MAG: hypothetical protein CSA97_02420 [Bacteroidota bacterium]
MMRSANYPLLGVKLLTLLFLLVVFVPRAGAKSQISISNMDGRVGTEADAASGKRNLLQPAVPLLTVAPDSRAGGLGDAGVATSPDANSQHWNLAKYAMIPKKWGISISYIPWLRELTNDINLAYLVGYYKIDDLQAVSGSLRYFSLGQMVFTNEQGETLKSHHPNEFAIDVAYSRIFTEGLSGGVAFRFIRSDLTGGFSQPNSTGTVKAGTAYAADLAIYYQHPFSVKGIPSEYAIGFTLTNIGSKLSYNDEDKHFIPMNMRLGARWTSHIDQYNDLSADLELSKLLIPTPPRRDANGDIIKGKNPDVSVVMGMIQSFYDAPDGFAEEMREITWSTALEYVYAKQFAVRTGFFYEHDTKGGRKFFSIGAGITYNVFTLDAAYLIPTAGFNSPMANTMRFSLMVNFDKRKKKSKVERLKEKKEKE